MLRVYFLLTLTFIITSCTDYLSEQEASYMPYEPGETLIFKNPKDSLIDTIFIADVRRFVPDGEQIYFNEQITAYNKNDRQFITLASGYFKEAEPYIKIRGFDGGRQLLKDIDNKPTISISTPYSTFNDVVVLEATAEQIRTSGTSKVYWSRSTGIVQFVNGDNSVWQLLAIERTETEQN